MARRLRISFDYAKDDLVQVRSEEWHEKHIYLFVRLGYVYLRYHTHKWKMRYETMPKYFGTIGRILKIDYENKFAYLSVNNGLFPFHFCQIDHVKPNRKEDIEEI